MTAAVWRVLFLGVLQLSDTSLLIRRCCHEGKYLRISNEGYIYCNGSGTRIYNYPANFSVSKLASEVLPPDNSEFPWWMDSNTTLLSSTTLAPVSRFLGDQDPESYIEYGAGLRCSFLDTAIVRSADSGYSLLHNGPLMVRTRDGNNVSFPPSSYCADSATYGSGGTFFVYLVCPCLHTQCMRSCCASDRTLKVWWDLPRCSHVSTGYAYGTFGATPPGIGHSAESRCSYVEQDHALYHVDNILWNQTFNYLLLSLHYNVQQVNPEVRPKYYGCFDVIRSKIHENYQHDIWDCGSELVDLEPFSFVVHYYSLAVLILALLVFVITGEAKTSKSNIILSHIMCVLMADGSRAVHHNIEDDAFLDRLLAGLYFPYFAMASLLWINVFCFDLAASFRSFWVSNSGLRSSNNRWFLYYNIYVWGVAAVTRMMLILFADDNFVDEYISFVHIPLTFGIVNFFLLSYTIIQLIRRQRQGRGLDVESRSRHNTTSCFSKHRRLLVHINLLLLMGPPAACAALMYQLTGPNQTVYALKRWMMFLRSISILLFVLLKPRIWILLSDKMKAFFNMFTRREAPISSGPSTTTTAL